MLISRYHDLLRVRSSNYVRLDDDFVRTVVASYVKMFGANLGIYLLSSYLHYSEVRSWCIWGVNS